MTTRQAPRPRSSWNAETKRWWSDFWASDRGQKIPPSLHPTVSRLFGWYHRRSLLERRVDRLFEPPRTRPGKTPVDPLYSAGSTGQPKVNPLVAELRAIEDQIEVLERRVFGAEASAPDPGGSGAADPSAILEAANTRFLELVTQHPVATDDPRLEVVDGGKAARSA